MAKFGFWFIVGALLAPAVAVIALFRRRVGERFFSLPMWLGALGPIGMLAIIDLTPQDRPSDLDKMDPWVRALFRWQTTGVLSCVLAVAILGLVINFVEAGWRRKRGEIFSSKDLGRSRLYPVPSHLLAFATMVLMLAISFAGYLFFFWGTFAVTVLDVFAWAHKRGTRAKQNLDEADALAEAMPPR
jgi:hypothetical protein